MVTSLNTPLTSVGFEKLKKELHRLKSFERPLVIQAISEARAHGDLSENAEYDAAKERQSIVEGRIKDLEAKISTAQIINPSELDRDGRVVFGVKVKLLDLNDEEEIEYQIVGDDEADLKQKKISVSSPIARALIGKSEGDVAEFLVPRGKREVEILRIIYDV